MHFPTTPTLPLSVVSDRRRSVRRKCPTCVVTVNSDFHWPNFTVMTQLAAFNVREYLYFFDYTDTSCLSLDRHWRQASDPDRSCPRSTKVHLERRKHDDRADGLHHLPTEAKITICLPDGLLDGRGRRRKVDEGVDLRPSCACRHAPSPSSSPLACSRSCSHNDHEGR